MAVALRFFLTEEEGAEEVESESSDESDAESRALRDMVLSRQTVKAGRKRQRKVAKARAVLKVYDITVRLDVLCFFDDFLMYIPSYVYIICKVLILYIIPGGISELVPNCNFNPFRVCAARVLGQCIFESMTILELYYVGYDAAYE